MIERGREVIVWLKAALNVTCVTQGMTEQHELTITFLGRNFDIFCPAGSLEIELISIISDRKAGKGREKGTIGRKKRGKRVGNKGGKSKRRQARGNIEVMNPSNSSFL